jgi:hypothetical protein
LSTQKNTTWEYYTTAVKQPFSEGWAAAAAAAEKRPQKYNKAKNEGIARALARLRTLSWSRVAEVTPCVCLPCSCRRRRRRRRRRRSSSSSPCCSTTSGRPKKGHYCNLLKAGLYNSRGSNERSYTYYTTTTKVVSSLLFANM